MNETEELEFDVRAEPALRELQTGHPEVVTGGIRAKVYSCGPHTQIQGRRLLTRAERSNPQGCTDLPLGSVQKPTDRRIQRPARAVSFGQSVSGRSRVGGQGCTDLP